MNAWNVVTVGLYLALTSGIGLALGHATGSYALAALWPIIGSAGIAALSRKWA